MFAVVKCVCVCIWGTTINTNTTYGYVFIYRFRSSSLLYLHWPWECSSLFTRCYWDTCILSLHCLWPLARLHSFTIATMQSFSFICSMHKMAEQAVKSQDCTFKFCCNFFTKRAKTEAIHMVPGLQHWVPWWPAHRASFACQIPPSDSVIMTNCLWIINININ